MIFLNFLFILRDDNSVFLRKNIVKERLLSVIFRGLKYPFETFIADNKKKIPQRVRWTGGVTWLDVCHALVFSEVLDILSFHTGIQNFVMQAAEIHVMQHIIKQRKSFIWNYHE